MPAGQGQDTKKIDIKSGKLLGNSLQPLSESIIASYGGPIVADGLVSEKDLLNIDSVSKIQKWQELRVATKRIYTITSKLSPNGDYIGHRRTQYNFIMDGDSFQVSKTFVLGLYISDVTDKHVICEDDDNYTWFFDRKKFLSALGFDENGKYMEPTDEPAGKN